MSDYIYGGRSLDEIKSAAEAATPGPWERNLGGGFCSTVKVANDGGRGIASTFVQHVPKSVEGRKRQIAQNNANSDYIAIANPATVLALIARIEELEKTK